MGIGFKIVAGLLLLSMASIGLIIPSSLPLSLLELTLLAFVSVMVGVAALLTLRWVQRTPKVSNHCNTSCLTPDQSPRHLRVPRGEVVTPVKQDTSLQSRLRKADWLQFEQLIAIVSSAEGYEVQRLGRPQMNGSVQLRLRRMGRTHLVLCRPSFSPPMDQAEVAAFVSEFQSSGVSRGVIVAPAGYTEMALDAAYQNVIQCLGEEQVVAQLDALRHTELWAQIDGCLASTDHGFKPADETLVDQPSVSETATGTAFISSAACAGHA